jgi:hypothetical protein
LGNKLESRRYGYAAQVFAEMLAQILPGDWLDTIGLDTQEVSLLPTPFFKSSRHLLFTDDTFASASITVVSPSPISEISLNMDPNTPKTRGKR